MSTEEYNENEEFEPKDSYESDYEEKEEEKPRKGSRVVLIIAVLALVGLNVFLGVNIYTQTAELHEKEVEIARLDSTRLALLDSAKVLKESIASLKTDNQEKDSTLAKLQTQIADYINQLTDKDQRINSLKAMERKYLEYKGYKDQVAEKQKEIDELKQAKDLAEARAKEAESANDTLTQRLNEIEEEAAKLANKVDLGKRLQGSIKELVSLSEKKGKFRETDKSSQVSKLQVKYTIAANSIANKETKIAYIIVKSGSKTFSQDGFQFELDGGKKIDYTDRKSVV